MALASSEHPLHAPKCLRLVQVGARTRIHAHLVGPSSKQLAGKPVDCDCRFSNHGKPRALTWLLQNCKVAMQTQQERSQLTAAAEKMSGTQIHIGEQEDNLLWVEWTLLF